MNIREEFESIYAKVFPAHRIDRDSETGRYINPVAEGAWNFHKAARESEPMSHGELHETMTDDFKAAWKNGLPLDSMEARWAFVGWQAARESEGGEAAFVPREPLYIRLTKDLTGGPDETFADIEDGNGFSVKISRIEDGNDWLIGPIYEAPKSNRPQPDKWILCSERLPTEDDGFIWVYSTHTKAVLWRPQTWRDINMWAEREKCLWMPANLRKPTPPEQESE